MKRWALLIVLACGFLPGARAACAADELTFNFSDLPVRDAFSILADFAKLKPRIDPSITETVAIRFVCANWRTVAEDLARQYGLRLKIGGGILEVSR